ncbi:hypothetical protein ACFVR2_20690 [Gottfriedia sp. NPDC057991]|uniref:hypothetical protein n=1 Tax=Gottfriedia sp. NPDC057991 TaxID=3346298 RepID=UPI0036DC0CA9
MMSTLKNRLFKDRIKQIVIIQLILLILLLIYLVYFFTHVFTHEINHIYRGLGNLLIGAINIFNYMEHKILKKKESKDFKLWLLSALIFFMIGVTDLIGF